MPTKAFWSAAFTQSQTKTLETADDYAAAVTALVPAHADEALALYPAADYASFRDAYETFRRGKWKRAKKRRVDRAEDGAVGANAEREHQHDADRESRGAAQLPETVANVLREILKHVGSPGAA